MIVMKFGGTSVADSSAIGETIQRIIENRGDLNFVILSACSGVTDLLIKITKFAIDDLDFALRIIDDLLERHYKIIDELDEHLNSLKEKLTQTLNLEGGRVWVGADLKLSLFGKCLAELCKDKISSIITSLRDLSESIYNLNECTPKVYDSIVSCGELMSTIIVSDFLSAMGYDNLWLDSRDLIKTNSDFNSAKVDFPQSMIQLAKLVHKEFSNSKIFITQGFIGSDSEGRTTTLGRGGSDYSAAVYGNCFHKIGVNIEEIQIWTDVNGVMTADPRIIKNAIPIDEMSFEEVLELSFYGAKVLHPDTIKPAIDLNIPVIVLNTFNPVFKGTVIKSNCIDNCKFKSLVPIFGCGSISFKSNNQDELVKISSDLNNKLNLLGIKILLSTISGFVLNIIIKQNDYDIKQYIEWNNFQIENVDLIAMVINSSDFTNSDYKELYKQISDISLKIYTGFSHNSILIESNADKTLEICKTLHDKLIVT